MIPRSSATLLVLAAWTITGLASAAPPVEGGLRTACEEARAIRAVAGGAILKPGPGVWTPSLKPGQSNLLTQLEKTINQANLQSPSLRYPVSTQSLEVLQATLSRTGVRLTLAEVRAATDLAHALLRENS